MCLWKKQLLLGHPVPPGAVNWKQFSGNSKLYSIRIHYQKGIQFTAQYCMIIWSRNQPHWFPFSKELLISIHRNYISKTVFLCDCIMRFAKKKIISFMHTLDVYEHKVCQKLCRLNHLHMARRLPVRFWMHIRIQEIETRLKRNKPIVEYMYFKYTPKL